MSDIPSAVLAGAVLLALPLLIKFAAALFGRRYLRELATILDAFERTNPTAQDRRILASILDGFGKPGAVASLLVGFMSAGLAIPFLSLRLQGNESGPDNQSLHNRFKVEHGFYPDESELWSRFPPQRIISLTFLSTLFMYPVASLLAFLAAVPVLLVGILLTMLLAPLQLISGRGHQLNFGAVAQVFSSVLRV